VPTTTLFATCMVYGRLSAENEILALKTAGTHLIHIALPAVFLGILASAVTLFLSLDVIPYTHYYLRTELGNDVEEMLYMMIKKDGYLHHPKSAFQIHVHSMDGRILRGVVFKKLAARGGGFDLIGVSKEAVLRVDFDAKQIYMDMKHCEIIDGSILGYMDERTIPLDLPSDWSGAGPKVRASDMTWGELDDYEAKFAEEKQAIDLDIARHQRMVERGRGQAHIVEHIRHLTNEQRIRENYLLGIQCEWHMRPALALGCLCFALIGCPVGIWLSKNDYLSAFVTCFLPIVTIYYPLLFCMINLARAGKAEPWLTIYNADALMLIVGVWMLRRMARN
jgi:lipopolysaccharide export system permease protein